MSEPEELIIEAAHFATRVARDTWQRHRPSGVQSGVTLEGLRRRLESFIAGLFGSAIAIAPIQPPAPTTWLARLASSSRPRRTPPLCATDGDRVYLAPVLDGFGTHEQALRIYRLLAVQQSVRLIRQTPLVCSRRSSQKARDLFLLAEAEIVDRWILLHAPGLAADVNEARNAALAQRGGSNAHEIEQAVRTLLATDIRARTVDVPEGASPEACAAWADGRSASSAKAGGYEPIAPVFYWGEVLEPSAAGASRWRGDGADGSTPGRRRRPRVAEMRRRPRPRKATEDEDDQGAGSWVIRADDPQESVEDPFGMQRPADRDDNADPDSLADSLADLPEARLVRTPEEAREVLRSGDQPLPIEHSVMSSISSRAALAYPEWDYRTSRYRDPGAIVRQPQAVAGDMSWVAASLSRHARLVRRVRTRFERLRQRNVRLFRQADGAEIDIASYVTAAADRRAGLTTDGKFYVAVRPVRRELAVALLLDVSSSTDAWVSTNRRIVDVEKEAMLIVCEALDALGDPYGLYAFSGEGPEHVVVPTLKSFAERSSGLVRRRIAALDSNGYTRLGAPIRHVTTALCRQQAPSRLLLLLSDGKPNDVDVYEGRYGLEDTRQAVAEARRQGVSVFCLTIDREAPRYASRIFGPAGFAVLHKPQQLPNVVVEVLRHLVRR